MNTMKRFVCFLLFLAPAAATRAQTWLAPDHVWTFKLTGGFAGVNLNFNLAVASDTVVNGQACKKIVATGAGGFLYPPLRFAYASGNQVYAYQEAANTFAKLYDFDLGPDSIVYVPPLYPTNGSFTYRIESVDTVLAAGQLRRRQNVVQLLTGSPGNLHFEIIEGIGMVGRPSQSNLPDCSYFFLDQEICASVVDGFDLKFICFTASGGSYSSYGPGCTVTVSSDISLSYHPALSLHPNPATDRLLVQAADLPAAVRQTKVFNAQGKLLHSENGLPEWVDTAALPTGVYWLSVLLENGRQVAVSFLKF